MMREGRPTDAIAAYRDALAEHPDSLIGYEFLATAYDAAELPDSVTATYRAALEREDRGLIEAIHRPASSCHHSPAA